MAEIAMTGPKVSNTQWELRLRSEFLAKFHPDDRVITHAALGNFPQSAGNLILSADELKMLGVWRRYADAIVFREKDVIIYEFALFPQPGDISLVQLYGRLFPKTPEYDAFQTWPISLGIVGGVEDPEVTVMAREANIRWVLYAPIWVNDYFSILSERKRIAAQNSRRKSLVM